MEKYKVTLKCELCGYHEFDNAQDALEFAKLAVKSYNDDSIDRKNKWLGATIEIPGAKEEEDF
jgi:hypothetical protein